MRYGIAKVIAGAIRSLPEEQRSEWAELYKGPRRDPFLLREGWTPEHRSAIRAAMSSWMRFKGDAYLAVKGVSDWSPRLGAALALQAVISTVDLWPSSSRLGRRMILVALDMLWSPPVSRARAQECERLLANCQTMRFSSVRNKNAFESFLELGRAVAHLSKTVSLGWPVSTVYCVSSCASSMADLRWGSICAPYDSEWVAERELQTRRLGAILAEALLTGDIAERLG